MSRLLQRLEAGGLPPYWIPQLIDQFTMLLHQPEMGRQAVYLGGDQMKLLHQLFWIVIEGLLGGDHIQIEAQSLALTTHIEPLHQRCHFRK